MYRAGFAGVVGADADKDVTILTPSSGGKQCHMTLAVDTANAAEAYFYEDTEATVNGTVVTPLNANRNTGKESATQIVFHGGTIVTTNATTLGHRHLGAELKRESFGGTGATRNEWVLRENTWYTLRVTELSGSDQDMLIQLEWYEHTPKQ